MKVLVAVGMTGGHIIPGIAVAEELKALDSGCQVVFAGTGRGRAKDLVARAGYNFIAVGVRGWVGVGTKGKMLFLLLMAISLAAAFLALLRERPQVVVGTGSYATVPFAVSALLMGIPTVLLEQNVVPGKATKLLSHFAREVHVAYGESVQHLGRRAKVIVSGNPVRGSLFVSDRKSSMREFDLDENLKTGLVFGGSRGARSINRAFADAAHVLSKHDELQFIVQTGEDDLQWVSESCTKAKLKAYIAPFIHGMEKAYACADIVVCRAGATTVAELTALGLPSILIPYPYSAGGHQEKNARILQDAGASVLVYDRRLTGETLASLIFKTLKSEARLESMAAAAKALGRRDAGRSIAQSILSAGRKECSGR